MFEKWLSKEENPSWEKMIAALDDMSENNLGSQLRKKYVYQQQARDESQTDSPMADDQQVMEKAVLKIDKQDQVARELESLGNYMSAVNQTDDCYFPTLVFTEFAASTVN